jgi:hypothetical protein
MEIAKLVILLGVLGLAACGGGSSGSAEGDSALLTWNAPATRVNGEGLAMGELKGYVIRYGRTADNLDRRIAVNRASTMAYKVTGLSSGAWYFAIQVVDLNGLISAPSEVVSKRI